MLKSNPVQLKTFLWLPFNSSVCAQYAWAEVGPKGVQWLERCTLIKGTAELCADTHGYISQNSSTAEKNPKKLKNKKCIVLLRRIIHPEKAWASIAETIH